MLPIFAEIRHLLVVHLWSVHLSVPYMTLSRERKRIKLKIGRKEVHDMGHRDPI